MMNRHAQGRPRSATARACVTLVLVATVGSLAACDLDDLLNVDSPSRIPAVTLEEPANAELMVNSAIADFECAVGAYILVAGLIGEELKDGTQTAGRFPYDQRILQPGDQAYQTGTCEENSIGVYRPLQIARASADRVQRYLQQWTDAQVTPYNRASGITMTALLAGYSRIYLGEGFCSMAISSVFGDEVVYGGEISRDSVFRQAETKFTEAIAAAPTADSARRRAALLGRARARLNLRNYTGAKADAELIPPLFVFNVSASATNSRRENRIWSQNNANTDQTLVDTLYVNRSDPRIPVRRDAGNTVTGVPRWRQTKYTSASATNSRRENRIWSQNNANTDQTLVDTLYVNRSDPRIPVRRDAGNTVTGVPRWRQTKYTSASAPIPIARYEEAQLILAEAELQIGTAAQALIHLNNVRARGNRGPLVSADPAVIRAEIIEERRRELFLEGHHLGDIVRYNIQLLPVAGSPYHGSGTYGPRTGTTACMPLPSNERLNNPNVPDNP